MSHETTFSSLWNVRKSHHSKNNVIHSLREYNNLVRLLTQIKQDAYFQVLTLRTDKKMTDVVYDLRNAGSESNG